MKNIISFKKSSTFTALLFLISSSLFANEAESVCTLTLKDSPKVRGMWLGMSEEDFLKVVPTAKKDTDSSLVEGKAGEVDYYGWEVVPYDNPIQPDYDLLSAHSVDGRLSFFSVSYRKFSPSSANSFVKQAAEKLGLPVDGWKKEGKEIRILDCTEFSIELQTGRNGKRIDYPALILRDKAADALVENRVKQMKQQEAEQRQREEQESRTFQP
jgi:hypothetical protein